MSDEIIEAKPQQLVAVIEQMPGLPWPEGDDPLEWEIDGLEGASTWLMHVLPLAATRDTEALASLLGSFVTAADERWGTHQRFDATRFPTQSSDLATYDRRSTPAALVRSYGAREARWWRYGSAAVMLMDGSGAKPKSLAAVVVLPTHWLDAPGAEEEALQNPLVEDFLSGENSRVLHAAWAIIETRDAEDLTAVATALPTIERATGDLDLGGALLSNQLHLDHALARVRLFTEHRCLCAAYPDHPLYEPKKERDRGHIRVLGEVPGRYDRPHKICECTVCGQRFEVEEGEYHYTWWKWTPVPAA